MSVHAAWRASCLDHETGEIWYAQPRQPIWSPTSGALYSVLKCRRIVMTAMRGLHGWLPLFAPRSFSRLWLACLGDFCGVNELFEADDESAANDEVVGDPDV